MFSYTHNSLCKENIYLRVTEKAIFDFYFQPCYIGRAYLSPLRNENRPSFALFHATNGGSDSLLYKDFGTGEVGNCFKFIQRLYNLTYPEAMQEVNYRFNLGLKPLEGFICIKDLYIIHPQDVYRDPVTGNIEQKKLPEIKFEITKWKGGWLEFWTKYGISQKALEYYNVIPITNCYINDKWVLEAKNTRPAFVYLFKPEDIVYTKVYNPFSNIKWLANQRGDMLEGMEQLLALHKEIEPIILTKSLKDVIALRMMKFRAVALRSETQRVSQEVINSLREISNNIISIMDNDATGIKKAKEIEDKFGIKPYFMPQKDVSDTILQIGKDKTKEIICHILGY